ncbi:MAG: hypothetical protein QF805_20120, partial [Pirellulaceae bacterium]|nr:hypothetical protein [Pirellulaceae bacterium]
MTAVALIAVCCAAVGAWGQVAAPHTERAAARSSLESIERISESSATHVPAAPPFLNPAAPTRFRGPAAPGAPSPTHRPPGVPTGPAATVPATTADWWSSMTSLPLFPTRPRQPIDLDQITAIALESSPRVRSLRLLPLIAETAIVEESSEFDPVVFAESRIDNVSDPVGNLLTTGGPPRLRSHDFAQDFGVRQRTATGGQLELSQQFGLEDSNSVFFSPRDQGNARMTLSVSHPLLNQHGKAYNTALIAIAELQRDQVSHESLRMVQDHI